MNPRPSIAILALLAAALAGTHAIAAPVTYELSGGGVSWSTDLTADINYRPAGGGGFSEDAWVGPLALSVTNVGTGATQTQMVYCTDIFDDYQSGGLYRLGLLTQTLSLTTADRIDALLSHVTPGNAIQGAAVQAAIWKLENDPGSDDITSGTFSISPDGITGGGATYQAFVIQTDTYLDNVNSGTWQSQPGSVVQQYTVAPGAGPNQTFAFLPPDPPAKIPEPAVLAVLSTGLTALIGLSRRRRRGRDTT